MAKSRKLPTAKKRATSFSRRRQGLLNKASEISMLCDTRGAVLVSSLPSLKQKFYSFGYPPVDVVFNTFLEHRVLDDELDHDKTKNLAFSLWEAIMELENCTHEMNRIRNRFPEGFHMDLEELEKSNEVQEMQALAKALANLKDKAITKMQMQWPQFQGSYGSTSAATTAIAVNNENYKLDADNWQLDYAVIDGTRFPDHAPSILTVNKSMVPKIKPAPGKTHYCHNFNMLHSVTAIETRNNFTEEDVGSGDSIFNFNFLTEGVKIDDNGASISSGCGEAIDDYGYLGIPVVVVPSLKTCS